jgi:hypothetical protein
MAFNRRSFWAGYAVLLAVIVIMPMGYVMAAEPGPNYTVIRQVDNASCLSIFPVPIPVISRFP